MCDAAVGSVAQWVVLVENVNKNILLKALLRLIVLVYSKFYYLTVEIKPHSFLISKTVESFR